MLKDLHQLGGGKNKRVNETESHPSPIVSVCVSSRYDIHRLFALHSNLNPFLWPQSRNARKEGWDHSGWELPHQSLMGKSVGSDVLLSRCGCRLWVSFSHSLPPHCPYCLMPVRYQQAAHILLNVWLKTNYCFLDCHKSSKYACSHSLAGPEVWTSAWVELSFWLLLIHFPLKYLFLFSLPLSPRHPFSCLFPFLPNNDISLDPMLGDRNLVW